MKISNFRPSKLGILGMYLTYCFNLLLCQILQVTSSSPSPPALPCSCSYYCCPPPSPSPPTHLSSPVVGKLSPIRSWAGLALHKFILIMLGERQKFCIPPLVTRSARNPSPTIAQSQGLAPSALDTTQVTPGFTLNLVFPPCWRICAGFQLCAGVPQTGAGWLGGPVGLQLSGLVLL